VEESDKLQIANFKSDGRVGVRINPTLTVGFNFLKERIRRGNIL